MDSLHLTDIMTRTLQSLSPKATLGEAVEALAARHMSSILVQLDGQVLGIVTEQDVLRAYGSKLPDGTPLAGFMSAPVLSAPEEMEFREAYHLMLANQVRHLLVLNADERPAGIVSLTDFERHLSQAYYQRLRDVQSVMQHHLPTLAPQATVAEAVFAMAEHRCSCVIVVTAGKPVGMLTERDVVRLYHHHSTRQQAVAQVMTPDPICITARTPVIQAAELMHQRQIRHLPVVDEQGFLVGLVGEADLLQRLESELVDLATHKVQRSRRQLVQAEARWRNIFHQAAQFMGVLDGQGHLLEVNASALALIGAQREEVLGHLFWETPWWAHDLDQQRRLQEAVTLALSGVPAEFEARHQDKTGQTRWVSFRLRQLPEDAAPHRLLAEGLDMTERHLATRQLRQAAGVFTHSHDAILITDRLGQIIDVNPAFCRLTGYTRANVIGQHARLLNSGHHDNHFFEHVFREVEQQGYWQGEVVNRRQDGAVVLVLMTISAVRNEEGRTIQHVGIFSDITDKKQHEQRLERMAHYDSLTGLPNRTLLGDRLRQAIAQAQRHNSRLAVAYLDLDGFKPVNDQFGHHTGDQLLVEVAGRLRGHLRAGDTAARLGGDEFVLLLNELKTLSELEVILARLLDSLNQPFQTKGHSIQISASIGITLYPDDGSDGDTLLRHADQAMYVAKGQGQNRYYLFDVAQDQMARELRQLVSEVRRGLVAGEFRLYYQPKVNLCSGLVTGLEALLRWQVPGETEVRLPGSFLPPLANHEVIEEIGRWVMHEALQQLSRWQSEIPQLMPVSINLAPRQLQSPNFIADLKRELAAHAGVPPGMLELEVVESAALEDLQRSSQIMHECHQLGVIFSLDDFGTGYSSLSYFKSLPASTLKIDQSFVREMLDDPEALAIVEGIIGLTAAFQRQVVAEGVESAAHGTLLVRLGCVQAQGYAIARPMPGDQIPGWIRQFEPHADWVTAAEEQWRHEDFPLVAAEVDHRHWQTQVSNFLNPDALYPATARQPIPDGQHCRLGRWLATQGRKDYGHLELYAALVRQHDTMHAMVSQLLQRGHATPTEREEFTRIGNQVISSLHQLQQVVSRLRQLN